LSGLGFADDDEGDADASAPAASGLGLESVSDVEQDLHVVSGVRDAGVVDDQDLGIP
jgi:hypothetical protein